MTPQTIPFCPDAPDALREGITADKAKQLIAVWKEVRGETLSVSKARRRLEEAAARGCPLCDDCTTCAKVRACPVLDPA